MSLSALKDLAEEKKFPEFIVMHKNHEREILNDTFFNPMITFCREKNIPIFEVDKLSEVKKRIAGTEIGVCVGFMEIIREEIFSIPKHGIINLHCGKLPEYRGRAPISRTIMKGNTELTLTVHQIDEGVDSGDILFEKKIEITDEDDVNTLYKKCCENTCDALAKTLNGISSGEIIAVEQEIPQGAKPNKKITYEERKIDWNKPVREIFNLIRAITLPYPGAVFEFDGKEYIAVKGKIEKESSEASITAGEILSAESNLLVVRCRSGEISLSEVRDAELKNVEIENEFKKGGKLE